MSGVPTELRVATRGQGMNEITREVSEVVAGSSVESGLCTVFIPHTSASLVIQENADPSAQDDLERWLARLVPEGDPLYRHTAEGPDDMPAHVKSAITATSCAIRASSTSTPLAPISFAIRSRSRSAACPGREPATPLMPCASVSRAERRRPRSSASFAPSTARISTSAAIAASAA